MGLSDSAMARMYAHEGRESDATRDEDDGTVHIGGVVEVAAQTDFHFVADLGLFVQPVGDGVIAFVELDGKADGGLRTEGDDVME